MSRCGGLLYNWARIALPSDSKAFYRLAKKDVQNELLGKASEENMLVGSCAHMIVTSGNPGLVELPVKGCLVGEDVADKDEHQARAKD